ncbi:MAG: nickel pincer cofactor biosynthesis protein LarB [Acidimicrobiales bacterium]
MDENTLRELLAALQDGTCSPDDAVRQIRRLPFADLGHTKVDHHRELRNGMAEAIYGPGKKPEVVAEIVGELLTNGTGPVILTRATTEQAEAALVVEPLADRHGSTIVWRPAPQRQANVVVASGGTADQPVVDECVATLAAHGVAATALCDVGVSGLHRLLAHYDVLADADAIVTVAGMEGALATVVTGLVSAPVVAVPTSTGYGAGLEGVTALLSMMASCASGLTVVGIDNGFGAAVAVVRLLNGQTKI